MEFVGNLLKQVSLREGDSQHGHWKIASYLLETVEMYPKHMLVDVADGEYAGRIDRFDSFIGKNVKVTFDIDAREYNGRWYNSIRAFGIKENVPAAEEKEDETSNVKKTEESPFPPQEGTVNWDMMGK